jgi:hypothetical protein
MTVKKRCCVSIQPPDQYGIERMTRSPAKLSPLKRLNTEEREDRSSVKKLPKIVKECPDPYEIESVSRNIPQKV